jgi:hypothetical protein
MLVGAAGEGSIISSYTFEATSMEPEMVSSMKSSMLASSTCSSMSVLMMVTTGTAISIEKEIKSGCVEYLVHIKTMVLLSEEEKRERRRIGFRVNVYFATGRDLRRDVQMWSTKAKIDLGMELGDVKKQSIVSWPMSPNSWSQQSSTRQSRWSSLSGNHHRRKQYINVVL